MYRPHTTNGTPQMVVIVREIPGNLREIYVNNKKRKITPGSLVAAPGLLFFNFGSGPEHTKVHLSTCAVQKKPEPLERREVEKAASFDGLKSLRNSQKLIFK